MKKLFNTFISNTAGVSTVEFGLIIAGIAVATISLVGGLTTDTHGSSSYEK